MTRWDDGMRIKPFDERRLRCEFTGGPLDGQVRCFPGGRSAQVPAWGNDGAVCIAEYMYKQVVEHGVLVEWEAVFCAYSK